MVSSLFLCLFSSLPTPFIFSLLFRSFCTFSHGSVWVRARFSFFVPLDSSSLSHFILSVLFTNSVHIRFFQLSVFAPLHPLSPVGQSLLVIPVRPPALSSLPPHVTAAFFARFVFFSSVYFFSSPSPCNLSFYMSMNSAVVLPIF